VIAIILLLLAVAIPERDRTHMNAAETVVMREIQTIYQAQTQYESQFGEYASTLVQLGPPAAGISGPAAAKLIPASLASGEKDGYLFLMNRVPSGFIINANPKVFGRNGHRSFYLDQDGIIHQNWGPEPASVNSAEVK
jgi:hypothetical protein